MMSGIQKGDAFTTKHALNIPDLLLTLPVGRVAQATIKPTFLAKVLWVRKHPLQGFLVLLRRSKPGRKAQTKMGMLCQPAQSKKRQKREQEPWLLVACRPLLDRTQRQIVELYQTRMQIDEGFRDAKSKWYGLDVASKNRISIQRRANNLVDCRAGSLCPVVYWQRLPYSLIFIAWPLLK